MFPNSLFIDFQKKREAFRRACFVSFVLFSMKRDGSVANTLLVALLEPNTGHLLIPFINKTLYALLFILAVTYYFVQSIHLIVLAFLAIGLLASINW